ncbi:hypothetical protein [Flavobacterium sp.]|uniref:hypothetical protein n=1 Tax=Flavobacterium sp. TaxID=239 RepID=UPI0039E2DE26
MKNFVTAIACITLLASCSSDNATTTPAPTPASTAKVASQVTFENDYGTFALEYNPDHTLKSAVSDSQSLSLTYLLSYANGRISNVSGDNNGQDFDVDFTYAANGTINGVTVTGVQKYVTYDAANQYYEIKENAEALARVRYIVNDEGDLMEVMSFNNQGNFIDGKTYYYEANQKGPLYNANRVTVQLAMACRSQALLSCSFGGYRPFKNFAGAHSAPIDLTNTFDTAGYVLDSDKQEDVDYATFTYIEL